MFRGCFNNWHNIWSFAHMQNTVFLSVKETLSLGRVFPPALKNFLTAYLPLASLLLHDWLVLYPSSNTADRSSQFLLMFLMNCWLNVTGPSLIYTCFKLLKHFFTCFLLSLFPHIPRPSFTFISLSWLPSSFYSAFGLKRNKVDVEGVIYLHAIYYLDPSF